MLVDLTSIGSLGLNLLSHERLIMLLMFHKPLTVRYMSVFGRLVEIGVRPKILCLWVVN